MTTTNPLSKAKDSERSERTRGEDSIVAARLSAETIAAQQTALRQAEHEAARWAVRYDEAAAKLATLLVAAGAAYDYFSDKTDADFDGGHFIGNREASLASELSEAIRKAKGEAAK